MYWTVCCRGTVGVGMLLKVVCVREYKESRSFSLKWNNQALFLFQINVKLIAMEFDSGAASARI